MRLIDTSTLALHEFFGSDTPKYCILSHRWETEEVTFQDLQAGRGPSMKGYSKILGCCKQAILDGWEYAWIDSCCIDKTSSAELSEAITSMFLWYKEAQVCYAFLSDVPSMRGCSEDTTKKSLAESKWFTRGWTLQELLAPDFLVFYDEHWEEIGTKFSLADVIQQRTGIKDLRRWNEACVAQKMYWASRRETTRAEDLAYSLLGIFGVYMPPLYGEGNNAFKRLQLEIVNKSSDESIFAWTMNSSLTQTGAFASSPQSFQNSGDVEVIGGLNITMYREKPYTITNLGLRLEDALVQADARTINIMIADTRKASGVSGLLYHIPPLKPGNIYLMPLNCTIPGKTTKDAAARGHTCIALILERSFGDQFVVLRHGLHNFVTTPVNGKTKGLSYVKQFLNASKENMHLVLSTYRVEAPVSSDLVKYVGSYYLEEPVQPRPELISYMDPIWTSAHGRVWTHEFQIDIGTSESSVGLVVENEQGNLGVQLLQLMEPKEVGAAWLLHKRSSTYRKGVDRCAIVLPSGTKVLASLRRTQGSVQFQVELTILKA